MSHRIASWRHLDDRVNPIVIKELRQAVNGRFLAAVLILFLLVSLITMSLILMIGEADAMEGGRAALMALQAILVVTCLVFLPAYAGVRFAAEHTDSDPDLMFITTIRPRSIIWGKALATGLLAVLIYSACMPFMTLTWLMRGVDLPTILRVIALGFGLTIVVIHAAIFAASLTTNRGFRVLLGLGLVGLIFTSIWTAIGWTIALLEFGGLADRGQMWWAVGLALFVTVSMIAMLQACSIAMISPPSSNRALGVRLTATGIVVASGTVACTLAFVRKDNDLVWGWALYFAVLAGLAMAIAVCERDKLGMRVRRAIPRRPIARFVAFFFYSGAAGGLAWVWLMIALIAGFVLVGGLDDGWSSREGQRWTMMIGVTLCGYCYSVTALLLRRYLLAKWIRPGHTWSLALVLAALGCALPALPAYLLFEHQMWDESGPMRYWLAPNPIALFYNDHTRQGAMFLLVPWAIAVTVMATPWGMQQISSFAPSTAPKDEL